MTTKRRSPALVLSLIVGVAAIGGCGLFTTDADDCTAEAAPAILLEIVDIATNVSPLVPSRITVTDGQFVERYPPAGGTGVVQPQYSFAFERAGRYSILVETPGFLDWSASNIEVRMGECHVRTARITARLQR